MNKHKNKKNTILSRIKEHIYNNTKQYLIICTLLLIGVIIGVLTVNYAETKNKEIASQSITSFINLLKDVNYQIDYLGLLKNVILKHILFAILIWFLGCSVIGIPIVYFLIAYKGFSLGYTLAIIIFTLNKGKGILFILITLLMQNILIIPAMLSMAVSGMNLYSSIIKNKRIENLKIGIIRHTIFCTIMVAVLITSALIEVYISATLTQFFVKYL